MEKSRTHLGVILAGGQGVRMGTADKGEVMLAGYRLVDWAALGLSPQVDHVAVNAPSALGLQIPNIPDITPDIKGPLAGLLAALAWGRKNLKGPFAVVTVAVDTPFFPDDLVKKLAAPGGPALAAVKGVAQTTFGLWPGEIEEALKAYTRESANPSIRGYAKEFNVALVNFKNQDQFFNINTPGDLARAEDMV